MNKYTVANDGFSHQGKVHAAGAEVEMHENDAAPHVKEGKLTAAPTAAKGDASAKKTE